MPDLPFRCNCGTVTGKVRDAGPSMAQGNHARCFCDSCRAAELFTGAPDPGGNGITVYQTTPDKVIFDSGLDQLSAFSFGPKNIVRWRADCCGALLFNTLRTSKFAFAALRTSRLDDDAALGPIRSQGFISTTNGKHRHEGKFPLIGGTFWRAGRCLLTGRWKKTPFFDTSTGQPIVRIEVLPKGTRLALLKRAG